MYPGMRSTVAHCGGGDRHPASRKPGGWSGLLGLVLAVLALLWSITPAPAQQPPLLESLSQQQLKQQMKSAPSGVDEPIEPPATAPEAPAPTSPIQETPSAIEQKVTETLNVITLEDKIREQVVQSELQQFGYDIFKEVPTTFAPVTDLPVPPDYIIGPGDTLVVQIYGKLNVEYRLVVTRDGRVLVPELGPIEVGGLRFDDVRELLRQRFEQQIVGAKAVTTVGALRTIRVLVVGDVVKPGDYTVSGLTTLLNTLMTTGGVKRTGTLRNIELKRAGQKIASLDLYDVLLRGDTSGDAQLQQGDVIFVPPIGPTVGIAGEVQRPAIYELRYETTLKEVIALAGGLLPTASLADAHIERIQDGSRYTLIDAPPLNSARGLALRVEQGDIVRVFPVTRAMDDVVLLSGHVLRPGGFQFRKGMRVSDLLPSPKILLPNADTSFGLLRRENPKTRRIQISYLDLESILRRPGGSRDLLLAPRDEVIVFDLKQARAQHLAGLVQDLRTQAEPGRYPPMLVEVKGNARYTGTLPLAAGARLLDVIGLAGGALPGSDMDYGLVARRRHTQGRLEFLAFSLDRARQAPNTSENLLIFPEDTVYLFAYEGDRSGIAKDLDQMIQQTPYGQAAPVVFVSGQVRHVGRYPLEPGMRISGLLRAAGGLLEEAYGLSAELTRYELLEGEYHAVEHRQIDLAEVARDEGGGLILQPHDQLVLYRKPNWRDKASVVLRGELRFPGEYPIQQGETLCQVIERAGGLTDGAYAFGSVFIRERVRKQQQEALDRIQENLDDLLVNLALSQGVDNDKKVPAGVGGGRQDLDKVISTLKKVKAVGRMVIDLKRAMTCDSEANFVLQDGDQLFVPPMLDEVTVVGEVYYPSSHLYRKSLNSQDYVGLSGGVTVLGREDDTFVVQANGEVVSVRGGDWKNGSGKVTVTPGATIYVPLNVDRMNRLEWAQSWTQVLYHLGITAASLNVVGLFK